MFLRPNPQQDSIHSTGVRRLVFGCLVACCNSADAQFLDFGDATSSSVSPAAVETVSNNTQRRLQQVETLVASEAWEEAIDVLTDLIGEQSNELVALPGETFVPLRIYCQMRLAQLPPAALADYRRRVDDVAHNWFQDGLERRDEELLHRVADELFCSSSGDEALLALGELALERGNIGAARRYWEAISPALRGPSGQPLVRLLDGVDLRQNGDAVRKILTQPAQPESWLAYPDPAIPLSKVLSRLIMASIRERDFPRAELELVLLKLLDPQAKDSIAGSEVELVPALEQTIAAAKTWPTPPTAKDWQTFAGNVARSTSAAALGRLSGIAWQVELSPQPTFAPRRAIQIINGRRILPAQLPVDERSASTVFPLVYDQTMLFRDADQIRAVEVDTGKPAITRSGVLHEDGEVETERNDLTRRIDLFGGRIVSSRVISRPQTMSVCGNTLLAVAAPEGMARGERGSNRIIGLDLARDALLSVQILPEDPSWRFSGPPVCKKGRLFAPMRRDEIQSQLYVACFSQATGRMIWRTSVCSSQAMNDFSGVEQSTDLLALGSGAVFFNTNVGVVAALEQHDGRIRWLRRYSRGGVGADNNRAVAVSRREVPCLYHRGAVVVAPGDAAGLFALDSSTGATLWSTHEAYDVEHLLGAANGMLVASGRRLWMFDIATGATRQRWPDSVAAGIRGAGRGCIAGSEVFWPTEHAIYVFDINTKGQSRLPIDLTPLGMSGVNLVAAQGYLILAGQEKLVALGPVDNVPPAVPKLSQLSSPNYIRFE